MFNSFVLLIIKLNVCLNFIEFIYYASFIALKLKNIYAFLVVQQITKLNL